MELIIPLCSYLVKPLAEQMFNEKQPTLNIVGRLF